MTHLFSLFCFAILSILLPIHSAPLSHTALTDVATRSNRIHSQRTVLTNAEAKKQKRFARQERLRERQEKRQRDHVIKQKKLQTLFQHTQAHRTSADFKEETKQLYKQKRTEHRHEKAIVKEKQSFKEAQEQAIQKRQNIHNAARNALR
jgi:hypothetical protein